MNVEVATHTVTSKDGTTISYETVGTGPALVLVDGALCYRDFGPCRSLANLLADRFTVYFYDRRGRGESGDVQPYAPEREFEDLEAVISAAGNDETAHELRVVRQSVRDTLQLLPHLRHELHHERQECWTADNFHHEKGNSARTVAAGEQRL